MVYVLLMKEIEVLSQTMFFEHLGVVLYLLSLRFNRAERGKLAHRRGKSFSKSFYPTK